jgi:hypothetical protein
MVRSIEFIEVAVSAGHELLMEVEIYFTDGW